MDIVDYKYVSMLGYRLDKFTKKSNSLYNFRCPICGDSEKNKNKSRGYLYERKGSLWFHCHNCGEHKSFKYFLKEIDPVLYHEYILERLKAEDKHLPVIEEKKEAKPVENILEPFQTISELPQDHMAYQWCVNRKLPKAAYDRLFFIPDFPAFAGIKIVKTPRIVIPFYDYDGSLIGYQGRALDNNIARYITMHLNRDRPLIYGLDKVDHNYKYYVVEGPFDSMFLDNAIAVGSSALFSGVDKLQCNKDNAVFVFDNEKRNKEIIQMMYKVIKRNLKIVIWPDHIKDKDINDMVLGGMNASEVQHIIDKNTYNGLRAELKFTDWKRS